MAVMKITEKTVGDSLKDSAHFLVTQQENIDGSPTEALRRIPINLVHGRVSEKLGLSVVDGQLNVTYEESSEDGD